MSFTSRLRQIQKENSSLLCLGLDTDPAKIPASLRTSENPQLEFNRRIIEATKDLVCAYKVNAAFYEAEGLNGWRAMKETVELIPEELISIGDAKRGDIGNSSERYASALFDLMNFDAVTVSPYMGEDSLEPFLRSNERCAFVLVLTSNPGSRDIQRLKVGKKFLYEKVVETALMWNRKKNIGFVVGATHPKELERVRKKAPAVPLLIPGIGSQGGSLESAVKYGCDKRGFMAVINASRSILYASSGDDFAGAARREAMKLREEINTWREKFFGHR
ncbi:MAG TPA: orotidine-5'-phosphate decarboxylase [Bacteroidota bacterium]|nr:orotidine-5'-phosphate decarboxylase [Bacteroidota bacterium]